jgi:hypothetical protein
MYPLSEKDEMDLGELLLQDPCELCGKKATTGASFKDDSYGQAGVWYFVLCDKCYKDSGTPDKVLRIKNKVIRECLH